MFASLDECQLCEDDATDFQECECFAVNVDSEGIRFELRPEDNVKASPVLKNAIKRMHINTGHSAPHDMARVIKQAGGSEDAIILAKRLRCSVCDRHKRPDPPRPSRIKPQDIQFNECMMCDPFEVTDARGDVYWFNLCVDDATGYITITLMAGHDAESLWQAYEKGWLLWAGPPDKIISDNERGLISNENVRRFSRSGSFYDPAAPYAPWQKGKAERSISAAKSVFRKTVSHMQVLGREEMEITGHEVASGLNHHINESGVSASLLLFGQRVKLCGEIWHNGKPSGYHPEVEQSGSPLERRLNIRNVCRQMSIRFHSKELVRKSVSARSRPVKELKVGERYFFYRIDPKAKPAKVGEYLGPAVCFGKQGKNYWLQYGSRPFLVPPELCRHMTPEEDYVHSPVGDPDLDSIRNATKPDEYEDLTQDQIDEDALEQAAGIPPPEVPPESIEEPHPPRVSEGGSSSSVAPAPVAPSPPRPAAVAAAPSTSAPGTSAAAPDTLAPGAPGRPRARSRSPGRSRTLVGLPPELHRFVSHFGWHSLESGEQVKSRSQTWAYVTPAPRYSTEHYPRRTTWALFGDR